VATLETQAADATKDVAALQKTAADAKAAQQRVETDLAKQQERAAKAERDLLELQERLKPRRLTGDQREKIARVLLANPRGKFVVVSMTSSDESYRYAADFDEVLKQCGWTSSIIPIQELGGAPSVGVFLEIANPAATPAVYKHSVQGSYECGYTGPVSQYKDGN
jgi:hypothetical protein